MKDEEHRGLERAGRVGLLSGLKSVLHVVRSAAASFRSALYMCMRAPRVCLPSQASVKNAWPTQLEPEALPLSCYPPSLPLFLLLVILQPPGLFLVSSLVSHRNQVRTTFSNHGRDTYPPSSHPLF